MYFKISKTAPNESLREIQECQGCSNTGYVVKYSVESATFRTLPVLNSFSIEKKLDNEHTFSIVQKND